MNARRLLLNCVTGLELGCLVGVLWLGARILPAESARADVPVPATEPDAIPAESGESMLDATAVPEEERFAFARASSPAHAGLATLRPARIPGRERDFYAAFVELGASDPAGLERAVRAALAGSGPDCEKIAGLRAIVRTDAAAAVEMLASAVTDLPDVSRPQAESVPRYAARRLLDLAQSVPSARRAVERLAREGSPLVPRPQSEQDVAAPREIADPELESIP